VSRDQLSPMITVRARACVTRTSSFHGIVFRLVVTQPWPFPHRKQRCALRLTEPSRLVSRERKDVEVQFWYRFLVASVIRSVITRSSQSQRHVRNAPWQPNRHMTFNLGGNVALTTKLRDQKLRS